MRCFGVYVTEYLFTLLFHGSTFLIAIILHTILLEDWRIYLGRDSINLCIKGKPNHSLCFRNKKGIINLYLDKRVCIKAEVVCLFSIIFLKKIHYTS